LIDKARWGTIITENFFRIPWLTSKIAKHSLLDMKLLLRKLYTNIFDITWYPGHGRWNSHLENKSIIKYTLRDSRLNYWTKIIFTIMERESDNYYSSTLDGLDLCNIKSENHKKNNLLNSLCSYRYICYSFITIRDG
jgi:hypothetical protein